MNNRFFAFGCSYTKWIWPTWADCIGINFSEYYNCGRGGASNSFIMQKLIETDNQYNFNETDYVVVMLTGVDRFSFYHNQEWRTFGEISSYATRDTNTDNTYSKKLKSFVTELWNPDWAIYNTWISAITIKNFLIAKNIPHKILLALDIDQWIEKSELLGVADSRSNLKITEVIRLLDNKESFQLFCRKTDPRQSKKITFDDGRYDSHPSMYMQYNYAKQNFADLITETTDKFIHSMTEQFDFSSSDAQSKAFEKSLLAYTHIQRI